MPEIDFVNIIVLLVAISAAFVFFYLQKKHGQAVPPDLDDKALNTLNAAIKEAKNVQSEAELNSLKIATDTRFYKEKLEEKIQEDFSIYLKSLKESLEESTKEFENYLQFLKTEGDTQKNSNSEMIRTQIAQTFVKFEENLTQYLMDTQQKSLQAVELELKAARGLIETYKANQLKIIDENIIAMLEKTLSLVFAKKLTLADQVDLVYEALEKAKAEKFIV
ncbi:MAG: Uncharacterized protein G01um101493_29 [Microgenomates group bacterium Gr01-1014_93]|nr:MAG: Uncharacterized protein G01um101493_29 [Microgenomates group bacterium Gr01-1014_93]